MQLYIWLWFCLVTQLVYVMLHEQGRVSALKGTTAIHAHSQIGPSSPLCLSCLFPLLISCIFSLMTHPTRWRFVGLILLVCIVNYQCVILDWLSSRSECFFLPPRFKNVCRLKLLLLFITWSPWVLESTMWHNPPLQGKCLRRNNTSRAV